MSKFQFIVKGLGLICIMLFCGFFCLRTQYAVVNRYESHSYANNLLLYIGGIDRSYRDMLTRLNLTSGTKDPNIVFIAIDDTSITKIGQWPWDRSIWANVINKLQKWEAKTIVANIFWSEPQRGTDGPSSDQQLATAIKEFTSIPTHSFIVPFVSDLRSPNEQIKNINDQIMLSMISSELVPPNSLIKEKIDTSLLPIQSILEHVSVGRSNCLSDADGICRSDTAVIDIEDYHFPSIALQAYKAFKNGQEEVELVGNYLVHYSRQYSFNHADFVSAHDSYSSIKSVFANNKIPVTIVTTENLQGQIPIKWFGGPDNFNTVPAANIISSEISDKTMATLFKNKLVVIGATATGLTELIHFPIGILPGNYLHLNAIHMYLSGWEWPLNNTMLFVIGALLAMIFVTIGFAFSFIPNNAGQIVCLGMNAFLFFAIDTFFIFPSSIELPIIFILVSSFFGWMYGLLITRRQKVP